MRIQKSGPLGTTNYLYDGANAIEEVDSSGNVLAHYTQGPGIDQPLAELRSGTTSYYQQDALSSVTSLSSNAGALANTYTYDSYGKLTASTGTLANPFQFTGREFDQETTIYFERARYYDPTTGRFASEDPIGFVGGQNFYVYVGNSPTGFIDPSGLLGITPPTQQQLDGLGSLFPGGTWGPNRGYLVIPMVCADVEKILENNGYATANNTPTSWYNSWLFNSPAHQGTEVRHHGGLHFVLKEKQEECGSKSCTITDLHNDPHDPLDHPITHIILDSIPWYLGTHPIQITHGH
jgi:RHS repeat-associated protein